jgi:hypothetical protein
MTTLKEEAQAYEPTHTKNIAELECVSVEQEIKKEVRKNKSGEEYSLSYINVTGTEYRVPSSVVEQLQTILKVKPDLKTFKVEKKGEGLNTTYTVVQLE